MLKSNIFKSNLLDIQHFASLVFDVFLYTATKIGVFLRSTI